MRNRPQLFTPAERRAAGLALLSAIVLALALLGLESAFRPSLGLYDLNMAPAALPNVIDARPLSGS